MLLGALLGATFGRHNLPRELVAGLHRRAALAPVIAGLAEAVAAGVERRDASGGGGAAGVPARYGVPWPLPRQAYPATTPSDSGGLAAPRDFRGKVAGVRADMLRARGRVLRYVPGVGAVGLPPRGAGGAVVLGPLREPAAGAVAVAAHGLDGGDAVADRAAAEAAIRSGSNGAGAGDAPAAVATTTLPCGTVVPVDAAPAATPSSVPAAGTVVPLRDLHASLLNHDSGVNRGLRPEGGEGAPGTGVFVYAHPADLAARWAELRAGSYR